MDISFLDSTAFSAVKQVLGFDRSDKLLTRRRHDLLPSVLSIGQTSTDRVSGSGAMQISALIFDAVATPPVKPRPNRTTTRTRLMTRKKRRLRRRSMDGGGGEDDRLFGNDGGDGGGGGYFGGGGGGGWNFGGGGHSWDDEWSYSSASDPASDFVYEVVCWIALSNCVHFAFKKVSRRIAELIGDHGREKVPLRLGSLC